MTLTYGFYDSVGGDRVYNAAQMAELLNGVITDGVFELIGNKLAVTQNTGMTVIVQTGKAWVRSTWSVNESDTIVTLTASDQVLPRIDTIVLEINKTTPVRANTLKAIAGTPAANPNPPDLLDTEEITQVPLAYVAVAAGATSIVTANITGLVGTVYCPYVDSALGGALTSGADVIETQSFS